MITLKLNPFQSVNGEDRGGDDIYPLHFHRVRRVLQLIHGFNDTEVSLVTPVSLLSKPILDLFQIQWAFH